MFACKARWPSKETSECEYSPNFPPNLDIHPSKNSGVPGILPATWDANFNWEAQELAIREYGIAGRVWEAAYAMISYIRPPDNLEFDPPFLAASKERENQIIVELGSGSGFVASVVARLLRPGLDHVVATDLPEVCPLLEQNLRPTFENDNSNRAVISVKPLSWGSPEEAANLTSSFFNKDNLGPLTHVVCSDLVYFPELFAPLLRSLLHFTTPPFSPQLVEEDLTPSVFISYKIRSLTKESSFWSAFGLWFDFRLVLAREKSHSSRCASQWQRFGTNFDETIFVFVAHRRLESFHWTIPLLDEDLLSGIGAYGTDSRKGDDTFENLLFMSMEQY